MSVVARRLPGIAAAPGLAGGPAQLFAPVAGNPRISSGPELERAALLAAMAATKAGLEALVARLTGAEAAILGFQIALLEDPELAREAEARIIAGAPADRAWIEGMEQEIAAYRASADGHFRARAVDLVDLRDAVLDALRPSAKPAPALQPGAILVAQDLTPSLFLRMDWAKGGGIVLGGGSAASHVAMLARGRGIPMVAGVGNVWAELSGPIVVDGDAGLVLASPSAEALALAHAAGHSLPVASAVEEPVLTRDGRRIRIELNIAAIADLAGLSPEICDGIGLVRTEFLVEHAIADEETQFAAYAALVRWAAGRPVTLRTLDAGGDKPIPGYSLEAERNPFLGLRGVRLSLARPEILLVQLRAILRAAALGPVRLLLPMVTAPDEVRAVRALVDRAAAELASAGQPFARPPLGMMVEVPAAAMTPGLFPVDFISIGTNDLAQYASAAARDEPRVANLADPLHPGTCAIIAQAVREAHAHGLPLSLCGDAAAEPAALAVFLRLGIEAFSVAPAQLARVRSAIRGLSCSEAGAAP